MKIEIRKPTEEEKNKAKNWPIWEKEVSSFPWHYDDRETCLVLEGEVSVKTGTEEVSFGAGDWVVFPKGLSCYWTIKKPVKKHYNFG
jgi:uncharacterized cupin superfamily protein